MRAHEVADAVKEELARAELRAERVETTLRLAEAQTKQMLAATGSRRRGLLSVTL